jgi:hypothetical protein
MSVMFQFQPQHKPIRKPWVKVQTFNQYGPTQVIFESCPEATKVATDMLIALKDTGIQIKQLHTPHGYSLDINEENYKELISSLINSGLEVLTVL